ncbi:MAG TPA: Gfo/Idh/MocA family oxidoreductase [Acidimicrobiales bacterium]|nr:Gfo/Idh/MocA family oxidoreductase [Acidimicrobiales bacterium]
MTSSDVIRIGILGAAAIAPAAVINPARHVDGVAITAIAARDRARAEAFATKHGIDRVHESYASLINDPEIDAVYIPLPNGLHGVWTIRAIRTGKHVLCEKPFSANATEAAAVAAVANASDRVVMEAFHWRYHPLNTEVLDAVTAGDFGQITDVRAAFCFPLPKPRDIRWSRVLAGGSLMDAGCYPVNMVRAVAAAAGLGEPEVTGAKGAFTNGGVDRAMRGRLRWDDGTGDSADGAIRCGMFDPFHPVDIRLKVTGAEGSATVRNPLAPQLFGHAVLRRHGSRRTVRASRTPSYRFQMLAFRDAIRDGAPFPSTVADAVANMAVIDALYEAAGVMPHRPTPVEA